MQELFMLKKVLCAAWALLLALLPAAGQALSREELRAAYNEIAALRTDASPYLEEPDIRDFSPIGSIAEEKQADALNYLNFIRRIAGLDAVALSDIYTLRSQNAALLLAANDAISHSPAQPEGMHPDLYDSALLGAQTSNLAVFNWMRPDILLDGIAYYVRDDGDMNLADQGHRRWLLNPEMAETGFGLASGESGSSYVVMYAIDSGNTGAKWDYVAWPAAGAFPVELMRSELAWSVSLNEEIYDIDSSEIEVQLTERRSGAEFCFDLNSAAGDGFCALSRERYGSGGCIIFRPEIQGAGIGEYLQNQLWDVRIRGLVRRDGSAAEIAYSCEMASLYPQDAANVELSLLELALSPGETAQLQASVVPEYADDLRVNWSSSDEETATVDFFGNVTGVKPGSCEITAASANGRYDVCRVTVE